ncbi:MAG: hypothetical protein ACI3XV_06215 [Bacteroidaceae bacterium]
MKKNFTKAMILTLLVAGVGMFNSCKDTDEDLYNDLRLTMQDKEAKLQDVIAAQAAALEGLSAKLAAIKSCECDGKGYQTKDDVLELLRTGNYTTTADVEGLIRSYIAANPGVTADDVNDRIAAYLAANNYATSSDVQSLINTAISSLATQQNLDDAIATLNAAIEAAKNAAYDSIGVVINNTNIAIAQAAAAAAAAQSTADANKAAIDSIVTEMNTLKVAWGEQLAQVTKDASDALALAKTDSARIDDMEGAYNDLSAKLDSIDNANNTSHDAMISSIDSLANEMNNFATKQALRDVLTIAEALNAEAVAYTKQVEARFAEKLGELQDQYATLEGRLTELEGKVETLKGQVEENSRAIAALNHFLNNMITNIIVQGTDNPAFGSFALPFGIQSNMLIAYYGNTENNVYFPTVRTANYIYKETALTEKDAEMLGASVDSYRVPAGSVMLDDAEGNAGRIFLTINPNTVNFEGSTFPLVNSQDEVSGMKLGALKKSDYKLQFGITRAADNGFYEATATVTEDNLESVRLKKDIMNNLKAVAKDVLTPMEIDFTDVASRFYNLFNGMMDANGVKASWTENGNVHSVYSTYNVAATAVKPLSYAFLYDMNLGDAVANRVPKLPQISPISEAVLNDLINLDELNVNLNLDLSDLNFTVGEISTVIPSFDITFDRIEIDDLGEIEADVEIPVYEIQMIGGEPVLVVVGTQIRRAQADTEALRTAIEDAINSALESAGQSMSEQIQEQLESALNDQLNSVVATIEQSVNDLIQDQLASTINGQLNGAIQDVMDQVLGQITSGAGNYIDQANGYIAKVNTWTNKFNSLIEKAEDYLNRLNTKLQVTMLYQGQDGQFHQFSNSKNMPTIFTGQGAAPIYLTSCSGELLAPAVKKFVAVTNVFKGNESAQLGNAMCKSALDAANEALYFNTVIPGNRYGIAIQNLRSGYTYEVFYSALDFQGKISARKFYVTVK